MHQSLLLWTIRKMTPDGFVIIAKDGTVPDGGPWNKLAAPPELKGFRPDACGLDPESGHFAFGEAKTAEDINSQHTRSQLRVFANAVHRSDRSRCRLYLSVPRSAVTSLDRVLRQVGLLGAPQIVRLHIPDCLVLEEGR
jgi:hypothetical protein